MISILLIESDPDRARGWSQLLCTHDGAKFQVDTAVSLAEAMDRVATNRHQAVVANYAVADASGLELVRAVRAEFPELLLVVLGGSDSNEVAQAVVQAGADDYFCFTEVTGRLLQRVILAGLERSKSQAELEAVNARYRQIYENTTEGIFQTSPEGRYLSANPALARIYAYSSPDELINGLTNIASDLYLQPDRRSEFIRLMEQYDRVTDFESEIRRKDGSIIWISENVRAVRHKSGRLEYYEGTVEDITRRKRWEENLRESEALYHSLVERLPQFVFRKNRDEKFTFANQLFCKMQNRTLEELIGMTDFDLFEPELARAYQKDDHTVMQTGQVLERVEGHTTSTGERRFVNVVKTPLYDSYGRVTGIQGIFWDITEKKLAEEELQRKTVELARSQEDIAEKNRQLEDDLRMARQVQQAMIPPQNLTFPKIAAPGGRLLRFNHFYKSTGSLGGDFSNIRPISDTKLGVFICDVLGHGVRSALITVMVRALFEELNALSADPGALLARVNNDLRAILRQSGARLFTTAFYMVIDLEAATISFANAGHPRPVLLRPGSGTAEVLRVDNGKSYPPLGMLDDMKYASSTRPLEEGMKLVLYTDGATEIGGIDSQLGPDGFKDMLLELAALPGQELLRQVVARLERVNKGPEFADDVCLLLMETERA